MTITSDHPHLIVITGPNGAGKSTTAPSLLKGTLEVDEFVNADLISQGLSAFKPEMTAFQSGRIMLERLYYLAKKRVDFAFETTLFFNLYQPLADVWRFYDNSSASVPKLIPESCTKRTTYEHTL